MLRVGCRPCFVLQQAQLMSLRSKISAALVREVCAKTQQTKISTLQHAMQAIEAINDCFLLGISVGSGSPSANPTGAMLCI